MVKDCALKARRFADLAFYKRVEEPIPAELREFCNLMLVHNRVKGFLSQEEHQLAVRYCHSEAQQLARDLESLPIADREKYGLSDYNPMCFALIAGEWVPGYGCEMNERNGFCTVGFRRPDGATEAYPCQPGFWADCDADGNPSMPWVEW